MQIKKYIEIKLFTTCEDNRSTMTYITGGGGRGEESDLFRYGGIVTRSTGVRDTAVVTDDGVVCYPCKVLVFSHHEPLHSSS